MEVPKVYVEEIYETFQEGEILGEEVTEDVDQSTTKEPDFLDTGNNSSPMATSGSSEELTTQQGTTGNKSSLDSIFGELPPKSLIKTNLLFPKPAPPKTLARYRPPFPHEQIFLGDKIGDQK
nr:uncharacterized protein LOC110355988 isoform X4 [Columba livia]